MTKINALKYRRYTWITEYTSNQRTVGNDKPTIRQEQGRNGYDGLYITRFVQQEDAMYPKGF